MSVTMTYLFLLLFTFMMIIVLVNLLNGLAVSDTKHIMRDSLIENQVCFINTLRFFESLYICQIQRFTFVDDKNSCLKRFFHRHIVPKGILLFHSPYLSGKILTFPLRKQFEEITEKKETSVEQTCSSVCDGFNSAITWFSSSILYENVGSDEFLNDARNILIQERSRRVDERRQKNIYKRSQEISKNIKAINQYLSQLSSDERNT